jgi:hypothetical protein
MAAKKPLQHPATLKSLCPANTATFAFGGAISLSAGPWFQLTNPITGSPFLYWEGRIDLGAFMLEDLTWVTTEKDIQEPGNFQLNFQQPQRIEFIEFITNTPLNLAALELVADDWETDAAVPGMMNSVIDYQNVITGRWRQFTPDTSLADGSAITLKSSSFGSCEPSASERLYSYCMVKFDRGSFRDEGDTLFIPGRRFLLAGAAVKEAEYEYIMRLRRSYVLQEK